MSKMSVLFALLCLASCTYVTENAVPAAPTAPEEPAPPEAPAWTPGTQHGYHATTIGLYMQELIRRVDPAHRTLGRFFRDEIATPLGLDFHIGLGPEVPARRLATLLPLSRARARPENRTAGRRSGRRPAATRMPLRTGAQPARAERGRGQRFRGSARRADDVPECGAAPRSATPDQSLIAIAR